MEGDEHKRTDAPRASTPPRQERRAPRPWQRWAFAAVPAVGLLELGAHLVQTHSAIADGDWRGARDYVGSQIKPEDLVSFAPRWVDPIGREQLGPSLATLEREARPDESRFPRAFEVSIRGAHDASLDGWRQTGEQRFGAVTVRTLENPQPVQVLEDLVSMVGAERMQVSRVDGDKVTDCPFTHAAPAGGGLGAGPALPGDRFVCPGGGFVAASVAADLDYRPRRCIYTTPPGGGRSLMRIRFLGVRLGRALHGHHGLYVEAERNKSGAPVTITFRVGDQVVGSVVHHDGEGWKPFEFDTSDLAGARTGHDGEAGRADLVAEIGAPNADRRMYCFEADTR